MGTGIFSDIICNLTGFTFNVTTRQAILSILGGWLRGRAWLPSNGLLSNVTTIIVLGVATVTQLVSETNLTSRVV